jgi:uncharacterized protein YodC (DUF2158 family)
MNTEGFNENDRVKLKSGGPVMVIARFEIDGAEATCAVCGWFYRKKQKIATIPVGMLEHAE